MKIILTGSLGHIGRPLTQQLVQKGHDVTVISSSPERQAAIEDLGASAVIGSVEDASFITDAFKNADAVYCMIPPSGFYNPEIDTTEYYQNIVHNYTQAIQQSNIKRVVTLSGADAYLDEESNGILGIYHGVEEIFNARISDASITFVRAVSFYTNLYGLIPMIKKRGVIATNYGGDDKKPWVSPLDIAAVIAEEITSQQPGEGKVRYVASQEISCNEIASILGEAIGKPDLEWKLIQDEEVFNSLTDTGMSPYTARIFVETQKSLQNGKIFADYYRNSPTLGNIKMNNFAKEFADKFKVTS